MPEAWFNVFLPLSYEGPQFIDGATFAPAVQPLLDRLREIFIVELEAKVI